MRRKLRYLVPDTYDGKKVFHFLRGEAGLSSRLLLSLKTLPDGILVNGAHARTIDRIYTGDSIELNLPEEHSSIEPCGVPLHILYEDDDILVVNKPPHLAIHPTHNHQGDTLANGVIAHLLKEGRPGVFKAVGRLDKCTSGVVVCALHRLAASVLAGQVEKTYLALPSGCFRGSGRIEKPILRPDPMKTLRAVGEGGEPAVTDWESLAAGTHVSLVRVHPLTGRTHQIRVHFASEGAPLLGDEMYGGSTEWIDRAALHCEQATFAHPIDGRRLAFRCEMPEDMRRAVEACGLSIDHKRMENE